MAAQVVKKAAGKTAASLSTDVDKLIEVIKNVEFEHDVVISISLAEPPAPTVETKTISASTEAALTKQMRAIVRKGAAQEEERYVLGIVLEPLKELKSKDLQNDTYSAAEVRKACHVFMQEYGNLGQQHQKYINGRVKILENWISPDDTVIDGQAIAKGTWLMAIRVIDDDLWSSVKKGDITGFSIGGTAKRSALDLS